MSTIFEKSRNQSRDKFGTLKKLIIQVKTFK